MADPMLSPSVDHLTKFSPQPLRLILLLSSVTWLYVSAEADLRFTSRKWKRHILLFPYQRNPYISLPVSYE